MPLTLKIRSRKWSNCQVIVTPVADKSRAVWSNEEMRQLLSDSLIHEKLKGNPLSLPMTPQSWKTHIITIRRTFAHCNCSIIIADKTTGSVLPKNPGVFIEKYPRMKLTQNTKDPTHITRFFFFDGKGFSKHGRCLECSIDSKVRKIHRYIVISPSSRKFNISTFISCNTTHTW